MYRKYLPWYIADNASSVIVKESAYRGELGQKVVLLNWNVHKNNHSHLWLEDFSHILHRFNPNLILFQEYKKMNYRSVLDKESSYGYGFFPNIVWRESHYGLINAAKATMQKCRFYTTEGVEPLIKTPKVVLESDYPFCEKRSLKVINVHMINFVKIGKFFAQIAQIEQILARSEGALILGGDFNTWNKKRMHIVRKLTREYGLDSVEFGKNLHQKSPFPFPLDHIFYRGLILESAVVLEEIRSSDHKPLVVSFGAK